MSERIRPLVVMNRRCDSVNWRLHQGFCLHVLKLGIPAKFYGPHLARIPSVETIEFNRSLSMREIVRSAGVNAVIIYRAGHKDMDWFYKVEWRRLGVPLVMIDVDFCLQRHNACDCCQAVDLHLLRTPGDLSFSRAPVQDLLPFSIDADLFAYDPSADRKRSGIGYSGTYNGRSGVNKTRRKAIRELGKAIDLAPPKIDLVEQVDFYQRKLAALTCSTRYRLIGAKHFEIPAAGCVLFTNGGNGIERYLPAGWFVQYRDDAKDVASKWREVQSNRPLWIRRARRAREHILRTATHDIRWRELVAMMNLHLGCSFAIGGGHG